METTDGVLPVEQLADGIVVAWELPSNLGGAASVSCSDTGQLSQSCTVELTGTLADIQVAFTVTDETTGQTHREVIDFSVSETPPQIDQQKISTSHAPNAITPVGEANLSYWLSASSGAPAADVIWPNETNGAQAALVGFDQSSGWRGTGTIEDPHHINMDGENDCVQLGSVPSTTISVWFRMSRSDNKTRYLFDNGRISITTSQFVASFDQRAESVTSRSTGVGRDRWNHLVITNTENLQQFFLNGQLFAEITDNTFRPDRMAEGYFGCTDRNYSDFFEGDFTDLKLYDAALTADQVSEMFQLEGQFFIPQQP